MSVIVVGAGIAGLQAAQSLVNEFGVKVIVLEAEKRVGGCVLVVIVLKYCRL